MVSVADSMSSFLSPTQRRNVFLYEKRFKRLLKSNRRIVWIIIALFFIHVFYNLRLSTTAVDFDVGDEYLGTYKEKFLRTVSNKNDLYSDEFYYKLSIMSHLDGLVHEPLETPSFNNSINPLTILKEKFPDSTGFRSLPLQEQANLYLGEILPSSKFRFHPIQDNIFRDVYNPENYLDSRLRKWLKIKEILTEDELATLEINDDIIKESILKIKDQKLQVNEIFSNEISNTFTHLKFFSKIFLREDNSNDFTGNQDMTDMCKHAKDTLFPWLSGYFPSFTKYNKKYQKTTVKPFGDENSLCFVKTLQSKLSGKGIVITASDGLVPELSGLLSLLRTSNTQLPIQIVHNHDLGMSSIQKLVDIATEPVMRLPKNKKVSKTPALDLTFVDVSKTIDFRYKPYFQRWGMKLLAYLFNSFEEMILLDTDTVPLLAIEQYFQLPSYRDTGTLFFRDREANSFLYDGIMQFFLSYLNGDDEMNYLTMKKPSEATLNNRFFAEKARHYMESGLFAVNKVDKFDGVLAAVTMQFFKLISGSVHGEKEFIWLGQEVMGQDYKFNKYPAVSVGELTQNRMKDLVSKELCSTHPGHISDDGQTLLWFNSGFLTCKKPESYYKDINFERNDGKQLLDLKKEYVSPLHITNALIPPPAEYNIKNDMGEPARGWVMTTQCENYLWCAYDVIGGGTNANVPPGKVISFNAKDTEKWDTMGETWVTYFKIGKGNSKADLGFVEDDAYDELGLDTMKLDDSDYDPVSVSKGGFASKSGNFDGADVVGGSPKSGKKADAADYEDYESSKERTKASKDSKAKSALNLEDAEYFDDSDSGKSKGFKETDDLDSEYIDSEYVEPETRPKVSSNFAGGRQGQDDSTLSKASKNVNDFFKSFGFGKNKMDHKVLSSFGDDSEMDLDELLSSANKTVGEGDVVKEQMIKDLSDERSESDQSNERSE